MEKIDLKKQLKHLYKPSVKTVGEVTVPEMNFLMIDGRGDPNTSQTFADAIQALYSVSYTLKFTIKNGEMGIDYGVMPLEGLWWADDMSAFTDQDKSKWYWTLMVMQPEFVSGAMVEQASADAAKKKELPSLPLLRFEAFDEGLSAQIMHIGPFSEEGPNIERVHDFIAAAGRERHGKHHEIYISDIRRAAPAKWKTVIRQPMR